MDENADRLRRVIEDALAAHRAGVRAPVTKPVPSPDGWAAWRMMLIRRN